MGLCHNCDQYNFTTHNCPVFCDVIRNTLDDLQSSTIRKVALDILEVGEDNGDEYITISKEYLRAML